jgi:hypothetical protein
LIDRLYLPRNQLHFSELNFISFKFIKLGFVTINLKSDLLLTNLSPCCINQSIYHITIDSFFRRNILFLGIEGTKPYIHKTPIKDNTLYLSLFSTLTP